MKSVLVPLVIVLFLISTVPASMAADAATGKEIYTKKCASCHGAAGEGKAAVAKQLKVELKHLGSKEVQARTDAELQNVIVKGERKMKAVTGVDAKGAEDAVAYMRTFAKK